MAYEDFLRNYQVGAANPSIPGLQSPVTLQAMPGTTQAEMVQQAIAQQQQAQNLLVQKQAIRDQQAAAEAERQAKLAEEAAKNRQRGGGWFSPIVRAVHGLADYPQNVMNAATNIASNPTSLMAWGKGMLGVASYAAPILNIPLDYNKLLIGEVVHSAAIGKMTPGLMAASYMMGPSARTGVTMVIEALNLSMPDEMKQHINNAYGTGYKQWSGGNGVWEYMQSSLDSLPNAVRYPLRAAIELVADPLTWVGVGAARDAARLAEAERLAGAQTPLGRLGARAERGLTGTRNRNPLILADEAIRKVNRPVDEAFTGIGYGAKQLARAIPGASLLEPSAKKLQEIGVRRIGWNAARFARDQEQNTDALFHLPGFTEAAPQTTPSGQTIHTLTNIADNRKTLIVEEADGNVRVITPGNPDGTLFPDAKTAAQEVYQSAKKLQTTPVSNVAMEAPLQPLSTRELRANPNRFDRNPSPRLGFRDLPGGGFEVDIPGRGSRIAMPDQTGTWTVTDEAANPIQTFKTDKEAYTFAANDLHNQSYAYTTLSGGQEVGPSFGAKPGGGRPQDLVAAMDQADPRVADFNSELSSRLARLRAIIQQQDEQTRRVLDKSGTLRRDLPVDEAHLAGRPRTNDSVAKSLAEAIGAFHGQQTYRRVFGEPSQAFPRLWEGDEAKLIRQFEARSREVRGLSIKETINTREAIRQALFTPNPADAETIIGFFNRHRYMVPPDTAAHLLLNPDSEAARDIIRRAQRTKGAPFGKILRENREELTRQGQRQPLPLPENRPIDPNAPKVVPTEIVREPIPYDPISGPPAPAGTREFVTPKGSAEMRKRAIEAFNQGTIADELDAISERRDELMKKRRTLSGSGNLSERRKVDAELNSTSSYREKLMAAAEGHKAEGTLGFRPGDFQRNRTIPAHLQGTPDLTIPALPHTTAPMQNVDAFGRSENEMVYPQEGQQFRRPDGSIVDQPSTGDRPIFTTQGGPVEGEPIKTMLGEPSPLKVQAQPSQPSQPTTFTTSKGSTYTVNGDGSTTRNKAARDATMTRTDAQHTAGGLQPASKQTFYVTKDDMQKLDLMHTVDGDKNFSVQKIDPEHIAIRYESGPNKGKFVSDTVVKFSDAPSVGLHPVETFEGTNFVHFGNDITSVTPGGVQAPTGVQEQGKPLYQALQDAGDDPVKRQQASDAFVQSITKDAPIKADQQVSGYGSYLVRGEAGMPEVSLHIGDDNSITITALDPEDPTVKNLVARAGTDVPVTVRRGLPDQVLTPAGLDTPATMPNSDKIADPLARSLALGKISQEGYDDLSQLIEVSLNPSGKGKKISVRIGDYYLMQRGILGSQEEALKATMAMVRKNKVTAGVRLPRVIRAWDSWINHQRDVLMFNWATGAPAGVLDHLGDTFRMLSMGRFREAAQVNRLFEKDAQGVRHFLPNTYRAAYQEAKGDLSSMMLNTDDGRYIGSMGIVEPPTANLGIGREETHREGQSQIARSLIKRGIDPKTAKTVQRAGALVLMDGSEFMMHMRSAGDLGRRFTTYVGSIRRQMPQTREDFFTLAESRVARDTAFDMGTFEQSLGDVFSPDDVRIRAQEAGADVGMAERLARDWQESVTKMERAAEDDLNKVLFSYEATRLDEVLKRIFLFHYWFSRATVSYTRTIIANPYLYANYTRAMDGLQRASDGQPGAVKGLIKAMSGPGGFMILMDPIKFMTTAVSLRDQAFQDGEGNAFDNFLAQSGMFFNPTLQAAATWLGLAKNDNPDPFTTFQMRRILGGAANLINAQQGGTMLGSPYQEAMNEAAQKGSEFWSSIGIPFSEVQRAKDPKANDRTLIRNEILDLVQKDLGIAMGTDFGQWTPEQLQTLETAFDALDTGVSNPYADQAYKNWARANAIRVGMGMTLPVGTALRSETRDQRLNASRRITNPQTGESFLPTGATGFDQEKDITSAASGPATNIAVSDAQFDSLFPANSAGRMATGPNGETQQQIRAQPQNAQYDAYRTWKADTVGGPDNYAAFRMQMEKVSPAYATYMDELRSQPFYQENQDALDNAGVSFAAYLVLNGEKVQQFDQNRGATFDISTVNPSTFGAATGQGAATGAPTSMQDLQSMIIGQLMSYQQDQQAFQQAASRYFGYPIQIDAISPYAQRYVRNELAKFGVRIPQLGTQASAYQAWARTQPMGSDTSIAAYLRSFGTNTPLTPYPQQTTILSS